MAKIPHADTAAERQALLVLETAYEVAGGIEKRRATLGKSDASDEARRQAKQELIEASERLINLLVLASRRMASDVSAEIADLVRSRTEELRLRLLAAGMGLVTDRAEKVKNRALSIVDGGAASPLGLAPRLAEIMSSIEATVGALGGPSVLPEEDRAKIEEARTAVARLAVFEDGTGILVDLS
ncbi:MAG TPA: hypothetical protein VK558_09865 [Patescibacteria group bacterium]|nr:hypothetical protein [Patescibacteria group bacterium]